MLKNLSLALAMMAFVGCGTAMTAKKPPAKFAKGSCFQVLYDPYTGTTRCWKQGEATPPVGYYILHEEDGHVGFQKAGRPGK